MDQQSDIVTALGYLCFGSRLKRLGERMQAGVAQHLAARGDAVQPAQLPLLMALHLDGAMTVSALGERVGISQPGVSRALAVLEAERLVAVKTDGRDKRQRQVEITLPGKALMEDLSASLFPAVDRAVAALCTERGVDLLGEIGRIEDALATETLDRRIGRRLAEGAGG